MGGSAAGWFDRAAECSADALHDRSRSLFGCFLIRSVYSLRGDHTPRAAHDCMDFHVVRTESLADL
jgi:hypothetical protein